MEGPHFHLALCLANDVAGPSCELYKLLERNYENGTQVCLLFPLIHTKSILSHLFNKQLSKTLVIIDIDLKCSREEKCKC